MPDAIRGICCRVQSVLSTVELVSSFTVETQFCLSPFVDVRFVRFRCVTGVTDHTSQCISHQVFDCLAFECLVLDEPILNIH